MPLNGLEQYSELEIRNELERRNDLRDEGKCDFCQQHGNTEDCLRPARHAVARNHFELFGIIKSE